MTRTVELFDGTPLEFPDDTPNEVVQKVVKKRTEEIKASETGTTVDDIGTGIKSGITTGAVAAAPGLGALITDIAEAPIHLGYNLADAAAGALGYDTGLAKQHKPGGYFQRTGWVSDLAHQQADRWVEPPKSSGGKLTREAVGAGIEALAGSGLFKFMGRIFNSYDDAVRAAEAVRANPALANTVQTGVREAGQAPVAQAAYSAAAGGGGEIAEQQGAPPIVGSLIGMGAAAAGHAAVPVARAGAAGVKSAIDEKLSRGVDVQERKVAETLRTAALDKPALREWAQRAQQAEDAYQAENAKGPNSDPARLQALDQARREAHGELVRGSEPTLFEAVDDKGIGKLQRDTGQANTADFRIKLEARREEQNAARLAEIEALRGEGRQASLLEEFRRQRAEEDAGHARTEAERQAAADAAAARAGTGETAEAIGERVRGPVVAAERQAKREGNKLYDKIGAEGVTVGTGRLKAAIAQFYRDIAENPLSPEERRIANLVKGYGGRQDFNLLKELRTTLTSQAAPDSGLSLVERTRAKKLRNAIDVAMDEGLARAIEDDPNLFRRIGDALTAEGLPAKEGGPLGMRGRRGAEQPKPTMPLSEFIARHGGLPLDAESAARDWGSLRVKGRPLAHPGGRGIDDYWRETLMEEGYIPYDYDPVTGAQGTARNVDDEIRRLLEDELHGGARPDLGAQRPLDGPEREMADARALIADRIKREGVQNPSPSALDEAARMLVEGEERHPTTAYERAVTQAEAPPPPPPGADVPFEAGPGRVEPPIDQGATERLREANRHWRENVKEPYAVAPVKAVVDEARVPGGRKMTAAEVPEAVFRPGNTGGEKIRAMRAAGATDDALAEAAALSFQQRVIRDGGVSVETFRKWARDHGAAISELPRAVQQRFLSAADAAGELGRASEARQVAQRQFDQSAVGEVLRVPPENLTREFNAWLKDPAAARELAQRVSGNEAAQAGLRRLVADHLLFQFTDASNALSKAALTKYLDRNMGQMTAIFGEAGARRFQRLVEDIERTRKAQVTGKDPAGPGTAGDLASMAKGSVLGLLVSAAGPKGAMAYGAVKAIGNVLKTSGMQEVDRILAKALLEPDFARQLLTKAPAVKNAKFLRGLLRSIARSSVAGLAYGGNQ